MLMSHSLHSKFACPDCRAPLHRVELEFRCEKCETSFACPSGIPSLMPGGTAAFPQDSELELSVFIMARNEGPNLPGLLKEMHTVLDDLQVNYELVVIDGNSTDSTVEAAKSAGAKVYVQEKPGYGNGFREGLSRCKGKYIITFDADGSHDPHFIRVLWQHRDTADLIVGSRYVSRGEAWMPFSRVILSRLLNGFMTSVLSFPFKDISSGFRLYRRSALQGIELKGRDFDVLIELLSHMVMEGFRIQEIPFLYKPRLDGHSKASLFRFAVSYASATWRLWRVRNSIATADYDSRAYNSRIYPQLYWQRKRYRIITRMMEGACSGILDVGCGSSKIIQSHPGSVGLDFSFKKLRFLRETNPLLVHGSVFNLPFQDESFDTVICSQVIEHIPDTDVAISELLRVLKPGGRFILGTPDFGSWQWPLIERVYERVIPGGYAEEHINPLTRDDVVAMVESMGATYLEEDFICRAEWVGLFQKR
jgi:dolichol-phosphate mannosyltransferase